MNVPGRSVSVGLPLETYLDKENFFISHLSLQSFLVIVMNLSQSHQIITSSQRLWEVIDTDIKMTY